MVTMTYTQDEYDTLPLTPAGYVAIRNTSKQNTDMFKKPALPIGSKHKTSLLSDYSGMHAHIRKALKRFMTKDLH